ncbi:MAG: electron transfer flavoprotein subunit alpha/FixB family protein [Gemmatimonadales bacterium]|nr:MAG: electron transfer flavoprotein subunit alpha/FixB family protein [Gemmatimonadales bacterium]
MSNILAVVEQRDGAIRGVGREVVSAAAEAAAALGGEAHALILGGTTPGDAGSLGEYGAAAVKTACHDSLSQYAPERYARAVTQVVTEGGYGAVFFAATAQGKDLAPRVAALLDAPLAGDVTAVAVEDGALVFTRPVYAGKAFAKVTSEGGVALASLRPNVFAPQSLGGAGSVQEVSVEASDVATSTVVEFQAAGGDLDVAEASIIVSGGRGMKGPENWHLLEAVRDAIGNDVAALGASRAVVDAGWRSHGEQVGQTGKTVSPKLYMAMAISGAIQHLAGMRTSQTIVAVNKDPDAPIFGVADYGVVGDVFEVLPRLAEEIRKLKAGS